MEHNLSKYGIDGKKSVADYIGGWDDCEFPSGLVEACNLYVKQPLDSMTDEGIRLLLAQRIGLEYVIPACVCHLYSSPFLGGDYEEGALIRELLQAPRAFWEKFPRLKNEVEKLIIFIRDELERHRLSEDNYDLDLETIDENLENGLNVFYSKNTEKH